MIDYNVLGINSKCALSGMPYDERFSLFKESGFESILLWGGEEETPLEKRIEESNKFGLKIESVHAPYVGNTYIWHGDVKAEEYLNKQIELIKLLGEAKIKTLVLHPEGNEGLPIVNAEGLKRYYRLFENAKTSGVDIAIENIHIIEPVKALVLQNEFDNVGFCFDSGHANIWSCNTDMLSLFGEKLKAIHLHDNDRIKDMHDPLFTGTVDWEMTAKKLVKTSYCGTLTLETKFKGKTGKELVERLKDAKTSGEMFATLLKNEYEKLG